MGGEGNCRQVPSLSTVAGIDLGLSVLRIFWGNLFNIIGSSSAYLVLVLKALLRGTIVASNALCLVPYGLSKQ